MQNACFYMYKAVVSSTRDTTLQFDYEPLRDKARSTN